MSLIKGGFLTGRFLDDVTGVLFEWQTMTLFRSASMDHPGPCCPGAATEGEGRIRCEFDSDLPLRPRDERQAVRIRAGTNDGDGNCIGPGNNRRSRHTALVNPPPPVRRTTIQPLM